MAKTVPRFSRPRSLGECMIFQRTFDFRLPSRPAKSAAKFPRYNHPCQTSPFNCRINLTRPKGLFQIRHADFEADRINRNPHRFQFRAQLSFIFKADHTMCETGEFSRREKFAEHHLSPTEMETGDDVHNNRRLDGRPPPATLPMSVACRHNARQEFSSNQIGAILSTRKFSTLRPPLPQPIPQVPVAEKGIHRIGQPVDVTRRHQQAAYPIFNNLPRPIIASKTYHRASSSHRFGQYHWPALVARTHHIKQCLLVSQSGVCHHSRQQHPLSKTSLPNLIL